MTPLENPVSEDFISTKTDDAPILWIASNCDAWSGRHHYVKELMKYIKVDSYGKCLNNKAFPEDKQRSDLMRQYKFYLAIENSNCDDYVTEKLFDTISSSTVPIVDGPQNYEAFIPTSRAAIRMDAYPDPRELADYINYLDKNNTAYLEYFAHRRQQDIPLKERLNPSFYGNWSSSELYTQRVSWCGVCHGVAHWWRARHDPSYPAPNDQEEYVRTDLSCLAPGKWDYVRRGPPYIPIWKPSMPDEFTRPWMKKRLPLYGVGDGLSVRSMWSTYMLLYLVFFSFIALLMYKRRGGSSGGSG
ncbi:hypothetical protein BDB00DRAFT_756785 [Zychaea mexicana]|uniref:uncharacterized protein n=1 Tax=Zychaea mexicana TaxID=64656 RepID=UPI0022FED4DC|nr:uncharacterized protein BDB00DRAFT_756785 [Zychaea mexicana]KAI9497380.1 hypothetical protein BDB00DRAFT_756785 [Zychaea mexicana]